MRKFDDLDLFIPFVGGGFIGGLIGNSVAETFGLERRVVIIGTIIGIIISVTLYLYLYLKNK